MIKARPTDERVSGTRASESGRVGGSRGRGKAVRVWGLLIGCLVAVGGLFHEALAGLVGIWLSSATYSYGFLIPPVALYLAYRRRHRLTGMTLDPSLLGAAGILAAGSVWFMGELGDIDLLRHLGAVVGIQATVVAVVGLRIARVLALPLAYLLLAVPLADGLVEPLQWLTADYTVELLRLTGVPVYLDGWFLTIPGGTFHVAEACAGVRYLVACLAFGVVAADSFFTRTWKRWAFVVISLIVPIGANVVRAYGIVMLAHLSDFEIAVGVDHLIYGGIFLSFVTVVLILVAAAMRDPAAVPAQAVAPVQAIAPAQPDVASASTPKTRSRWRAARAAGVIVIALFGLAGLRGYAAAVAPASAPVGPVEIEPPQVAGWADPRPARSTWQPSFPSADATAVWRYTKAQSTVELFVARYTPLRPGAELVAMQNDLAGGERNTVMARGVTSVDGGGAWPPPAYLRLATRDGERLVWYWYVVGGEATTTGWRAKARRLALQLLGPVDGAAVAVATQAGPEAQSRLRSFMADADLRGTLGARNGSRQGD